MPDMNCRVKLVGPRAALLCGIFFVMIAALTLLAGCNIAGQNQTIVTISPKPATVDAGASVTFTASLQHNHHSGLGVNWALSGQGSLSNQQPFAVTYMAPSTVPSNPSVSITATSQETSSASDSATFAITAPVITGNNYVGAQSPGEVWLFTLDDVGNQFSAQNETSGLTYSGTTSPLPNGFLATTITNSNDPNLPSGSTGYAIEVPNVAAMLALGGATDKPVALLAQSPCPTLTSATNVQLINLGKSTYDSTTSESYAAVTAAQSGSNYNFSLSSYLLNGGLRTPPSGALPSGTCGNNVITIPNVPAGGGTTTATVAAASNGLYIIDLGPGNGAAVGSQNFVTDPNTLNTAMGATYLGVVFRRNSTPITTFVGFGPGAGTSISGGSFANPSTDPFSNHDTNIIISLTTPPNADGFLQGTVTDTTTGLTHAPFVAMVTQDGGQFFLFGITTDTSTSTPYVIILAQP